MLYSNFFKINSNHMAKILYKIKSYVEDKNLFFSS